MSRGPSRNTAARVAAFTLSVLSLTTVGQCDSPPPVLNALAAVVMDAKTGRVVFSKNAELQLPPASTTKIMTGLLLTERCKPDETITAPLDVTETKESSMHLVPGEQVKAEELLYAMMLRSANDGCHTLACHIAGSDAEFAKIMNERAHELGCTKTNFVNPHGLQDPNHLTTALDLARIARYAMTQPMFAKVVGTKKKVIERSLNLKDTLMVNRDKWLSLEPTALGVKTGFTKEAGHCFVGCAQKGDMTFITVVMKSDQWLPDQVALTQWVYKNFEVSRIVEKGERIGSLGVKDGTVPQVQMVAAEDVSAMVSRSEIAVGKTGLDPKLSSLSAPVSQTESMVGGEYVFTTGERFKFAVSPERAVDKRPFVASILNPGTIVGFALLGGSAVWMRARSRKMLSDRWSIR